MSYHNPDILYTLDIDVDLFREREEYDGDFEIIGDILEDNSEENCKRLLWQVIDYAKKDRGFGCTDFYDWFFDSHWYEQMWDAVNSAVDDYIALTARKIVDEQKED